MLETTTGKISYVAAVTLILTSLGCWVVLGHQDDSVMSSTAQAAMTDNSFANEAAHGGAAEIQLGKLALDNGASEAVKTFGTRMVTEQTRAGDQLKQAAAREHVTLPTDLDAREQATYDKLSKLNGDAFDQAYAQEMVRDHQEDLKAFEREANYGNSDLMRAFASQTVPMIQQHLEQAEQIFKIVSPKSSRRTNGISGRPTRGQ